MIKWTGLEIDLILIQISCHNVKVIHYFYGTLEQMLKNAVLPIL